MQRLRIEGTRFLDEDGREVHLRGVNLSGSSKFPPDEPTHRPTDFSNHRQVSFIGRPFPLEEADEHYARLRHWGFNVLRFIVTWEAIEHAGPGQYDTDYLDYLTEVVRRAGKYGLHIFIDPHQDVWSRMTGGDGAPGWTLEAAGFNIQQLDASEAAITMQRRYPDYTRMLWTDNYSRLACNTMFTLFFCGNVYAPDKEIDGRPVQDFLQNAFIRSIQQVARRLKDMPHVIGYGPMNEPGKGYIGIESLNEVGGFPQKHVQLSPAESILVGAGFPRRVPTVELDGWQARITGETVLNPDGISAWASPDLWHELGIWDYDAAGQPAIICDDFFSGVSFLDDGLLPFMRRYTEAIREIDPQAMIFVESTPTEAHHFRLDESFTNIVNTSHWYDEYMLFTGTFDGQHGMDVHTREMVNNHAELQATFNRNIGNLRRISEDLMGGVPTLIGEFGLAYNINGASAYADGDYAMHELALSMYYTGMDTHLAHSAQWNYTPDNTNQWGDGWNLEDISIFSRDQQDNLADIHSGGRAIRGFCRPHLPVVAGQLLSRMFDYPGARFEAVVRFDERSAGDTLIYVPDIWYARGYVISVSSGQWTTTDTPQILRWYGAAPGEQQFLIEPAREGEK